MITLMLILIMLFVLLKTQNFLSLKSRYWQDTNGLNNHCIGMNTKEKARIKIQETSVNILSGQTLLKLTDCLFWFF